jgi:hypothetical protein
MLFEDGLPGICLKSIVKELDGPERISKIMV